jgi:hypothetical protein
MAAPASPGGAKQGKELVNEHPDEALMTVDEKRSARMIAVVRP